MSMLNTQADELREHAVDNAQPDSRERLEADVAGLCRGDNSDRYFVQKLYLADHDEKARTDIIAANHEGHVLMSVIMHLLDRQAAITKAECEDDAEFDCMTCFRVGLLQQDVDKLRAMISHMVSANRRLRDEIDRDRCVGGPGTMVRADAVMAWLDSIIDLDAIRDLGIELEGGRHEAEV